MLKKLLRCTCAYISPDACLRFSIYLSVIFFLVLSYRQMYRKFKKVVLGLLMHVTPSIFSVESLGVKRQFTNIDIFFRTAVLRKLFDIRFSYKHCNFSHICLLIKMALKPVTRSIPNLNHLRPNSDQCQFSPDNIH